tara:strand:- start:577 stop:1818 length:1242 start_codon:yes stop_codon:yes gene_type:complete
MLRNKKFQIDKLLITILLLISGILSAQENKSKFKIQYNPHIIDSWWLEKNNFGIKPTKFDFQTKWKLKKEDFAYSINILFQKNKNYVGESFIKYNFSNKTFLRIGKYYRDFSSYLNDELSSGHMLISHNAEPMPKIGLITSYKPEKFEKINFDFGISHSFFDKNTFYTKSPMLHEKFIYLKINNNNNEIGIGLIHEAIWGGNIVGIGSQPSTFKDFLKVFLSEDGPNINNHPHANALGNHLGVWDFYYQMSTNDKLLKFYYQHFFEDTSGFRFRNEIDGLWGIELNNYITDTIILFEYLDTTHQDMNPPYVNDAYYNHSEYVMGWSYKDYTLGNPFINHRKVEPTEVFHIGISGIFFSDYDYQLKISKKTNINDFIKYQINVNKKINTTNTIGLFIINNDENIGLGANIAWIL